jgi:hypothetical protein
MMVKAGEVVIEVRAEIADLQKGMKQLRKEISEVKNSSNKTKSGVDDLSKVFKNLNLITKGVQAVLASTAVTMTVDFVKAAGEAADTMGVFAAVSGSAAEVLMTDLRKATRGMVSDLELMRLSSRATAIGIRSDLQAPLFEVARTQAKLMGIEISQAFDTISMSVQTGNTRMLRNVGIILDANSIYKKYAATLGTTAALLTENQKQQALLEAIEKRAYINKVLLEDATQGLDDATKILTADLKNLWNDVLKGVADEYARIKQNMDEARTGMTIDPATLNAYERYKKLLADANAELNTMQGNVDALNAKLDMFASGKFFSQEELDAKTKSRWRSNEMDKTRLRIAELEMRSGGMTKHELGMALSRGQITAAQYKKELMDLNELDKRKKELDAQERENRYRQLKDEVEIYNVKEGIVEQAQEEQLRQAGLVGYMRDFSAEWAALPDKITTATAELNKANDIVHEMATAVEFIGENLTRPMTEEEKASKSSGGGAGLGMMPTVSEYGSRNVSGNRNFNTNRRSKLKYSGTTRTRRDFVWSPGRESEELQDFMFRPGKAPVRFSKNDTIIGMKNPEKLIGKGTGISLTINGDVYGVDADQIAYALQTKLNSLITI